MSLKRVALFVASICTLAFSGFLVSTSDTEAHERRTVGAYNFVVGWLNEPALLNEPNAISLTVARASDSSPVSGLEQTLKFQAKSGEKSVDVQVRPRFNTAGAYDGRLLPTATGVYSFTITGTIEGQNVNETFTAGTGTFGLIEEGNAFPNPLPSNQGIEQRLVMLESRNTDSDSSDSAMMVGMAGVIIGVVGLAVGGFSLTKKSV